MRLWLLFILIAFSSTACVDLIVDERGIDAAEEDDDDVIIPPSEVTAVQLASIKSRCGHIAKSKTEYEVKCSLVVLGKDGKETKISTLPVNIEVKWQTPKVLAGEGVQLTCEADESSVSNTCQTSTATGQAKIQFDVDVKDKKSSDSKVESEIVLLPYSVSVAAGFLMSIPNDFASENKDKKELGFQPRIFPSKNATIFSHSICQRNQKTYYSHFSTRTQLQAQIRTSVSTGYIFEEYKGNSQRYAGSGFGGDDKGFSHRLKLKLGPRLYLTCRSDGVIVSDTIYKRILKIGDDAKVEVLADFSEQGIAPLQVVFDKEGAMYFISTEVRSSSLGTTKSTRDLMKVSADGKAVSILPKDLEISTIGDLLVWKDEVVFTDTLNHKIISLDMKGGYKTLAGTGARGFSGDSDQASKAQLAAPVSLSLAADGSLMFADGRDASVDEALIRRSWENRYCIGCGSLEEDLAKLDPNEKSRVRKIDTKGVISTLTEVPDGIVHDFYQMQDGSFHILTITLERWFVSEGKNGVFKPIISTADEFIPTADLLPAKSTTLGRPSAMQINKKGEIFYLDTATNTVRKVRPDGQIELVAKLYPQSRFSYLIDMALAPDGDLYVTEYSNSRSATSRILVVKPDGKVFQLEYLKAGQPTIALNFPKGIAVADNGDIYIAEANYISKIKRSNGVYSEVPGSRREEVTGLGYNKIVIHEDKLYLSEENALFVLEDSKLSKIAGNDEGKTEAGSPAGDTKFTYLNGMVIDSSGKLFLADANAGKIKRMNKLDSQAIVEDFFGLDAGKENKQCASGKVSNEAVKNDIDKAIQTSLSYMCAGDEISALTSYDGCSEEESEHRVHRMAFAQRFEDGFNIIQIVRACED